MACCHILPPFLDNKKPPEGGRLLQTIKLPLTDRRGLRTRQHHGLASLDDVGGLGVTHIGARRDPKSRHRDSGNQRYEHDLQMRRTISRMN